MHVLPHVAVAARLKRRVSTAASEIDRLKPLKKLQMAGGFGGSGSGGARGRGQGGGGGGDGDEVRLYTSNPVDHSWKTPGFNP